VCTEANTVLRLVVADFFFRCWCLEIPLDNHIWHVPRCMHYHAKSFDRKRSRTCVGSGSHTPELYSVSPYWFKYCFIYEKFVACI
jgi:hypothetical protein